MSNKKICFLKFCKKKESEQIEFIIIIFYFENVAFIHAKLGLDVCPRVDNQTSGETLQDLAWPLVEKKAISQLYTHGYWRQVFGGEMPFHTN